MRNTDPGGYHKILADDDIYKSKVIVVFPGRRLSLQKNQYRVQHWNIIDGQAAVTLNEKTFMLASGQSVDIPKGTLHRIANPGSKKYLLYRSANRRLFRGGGLRKSLKQPLSYGVCVIVKNYITRFLACKKMPCT